MSLHRLVMAAAFAAAIASVAPLAHAAPPGGPAIEGVDVEQVSTLAAGVPLRFTVYGTPGASVVVRIEGGARALALRESDPGIYEGTYVIDSRDAIDPGSRVSATLQQGARFAGADLDEPLLLAQAPLPWADAQAQVAAESATPAAAARSSLPVPPAVAAPPAALPSSPAAPPPRSVPTRAPLPAPATRAAIERSVAGSALPVVSRGPERVLCGGCARVESVREVEARPGGAIGAVAGAIAGAVLGNELGQAHTRRMLRILGAIGGAFAGREIERQATPPSGYEVVLRTNDGRTQVRRYDRAPPFAPGATVRLESPRGEPAPF